MTIFKPDFPTWEEAFYNKLDQIGGQRPKNPLKADGKVHRFSFNGKPSNSSGWYIVFEDEVVSGCVGNWGSGEKVNFCWSSRRMTEYEMVNIHQKWAEHQKRAEEARIEAQRQAAIDAQAKWECLSEATETHPYALKKGIRLHGVRQGQKRLYVPLYDENGNMVSLQSIDDKGQKLFMQNGRVKGCYFLAGTPKDELIVAEGYATAMSLREATGKPVMVAFNAGNIAPAIESIKQRFPNVSITICADNDETGLRHAKQAAEKYGCGYVYPSFSQEEIKENGNITDFNDFHKVRGIQALKSFFEETKKQNKFNVLGFDDLLTLPKIEWIVQGVFPKKSFGVIYGEPAKGKTFVALDMALHIAHGMDWHDRAVVQGSVLYIAGEGVGGLPKRLKAWTYQNAPDGEKPPFYAIAANVNMREPEDVEHIISAIQAIGSKFSVIFIDTVARAILGGDENSSTDMGLFVASCDKIKDATGAAVIGIHHSGKDADRGMRGSSALLGAVDSVIQVTQETEGTIILKNEKQKDGEPFKDMAFKTVVISTGITETSLIIEAMDCEYIPSKKTEKKRDLALQFLMDCIAVDSQTIRGYPATKIDTWRHECDKRELGGDTYEAKKKAFQRSKNKLQNDGIIACENGLVMIVEEGV